MLLLLDPFWVVSKLWQNIDKNNRLANLCTQLVEPDPKKLLGWLPCWSSRHATRRLFPAHAICRWFWTRSQDKIPKIPQV